MAFYKLRFKDGKLIAENSRTNTTVEAVVEPMQLNMLAWCLPRYHITFPKYQRTGSTQHNTTPSQAKGSQPSTRSKKLTAQGSSRGLGACPSMLLLMTFADVLCCVHRESPLGWMDLSDGLQSRWTEFIMGYYVRVSAKVLPVTQVAQVAWNPAPHLCVTVLPHPQWKTWNV